MAIRPDAHLHSGRPYSKSSWNATLPWSQPLVPMDRGHGSGPSDPSGRALRQLRSDPLLPPSSHPSMPMGVFYYCVHLDST